MIVVSNTSPLRYLLEIDAITILPQLFGEVWTVPSVIAELQLPNFPPKVIAWAENPPSWLKIKAPKQSLGLHEVLDPGEADAIALAVEKKALRLLIDERAGVQITKQVAAEQKLALKPVGTLTLLAVAAERGQINFQQVTNKLLKTKFRCTAQVLEKFLEMEPDIKSHVQREGDLYPSDAPEPDSPAGT